MVANFICRNINGERHYVCYNEEKREVAWITMDSMKNHPGYGRVSWNTKELADARAKEFGYCAYVVSETI